MATRGQIQIDVVADTSKFAADVRRQLKAATAGLKVKPVKIDGDAEPLKKKAREAAADVDKTLKKSFDQIKTRAEAAGAGIGRALVVGLIAAVSSGLGPLIASTASLFASFGPAILASVTAAVGGLVVLKVATLGVGEAIKQLAEGDLEKFDQALAKLSPNAQGFAKAIQSVLPQLREIKSTVQDRFFAGLDDDVKSVTANLSGPLKAGMGAVAGSLNGIVRAITAFLSSAKGVEFVNTIFEVTNVVLTRVKDAFGPLLDRFADWVIKAGDSGVNSMLTETLNTIKSLGAAASNVAGAIGAIYGGLTKDGPDVAKSLEDSTKALRDFLESAKAQEFLTTLRGALADLRDIFKQLGGDLISMLPALTGLASGGFGVLLGAVQGLLFVLGPVADALGGQKGLFEVLGGAIAVTVIAVKSYQTALAVAAVKQGIFNAVMTEGTIANRIFTAASNTSRVAMLLLSTGFAQAGAAATTLAASLYAQVTALLSTAAAWAATALQATLNTIRLIAYTVAVNAVRAATIAWTAVQWLLNAALTANPIGLIIAAIVALVAAIIYAYQNSETFRDIVDAAFSAIADAAIWLWENALKPLWDGIVAGFDLVSSAASVWWSTVSAYFNFLADVFITVRDGMASFVSSVISFFADLASGAGQRISNLIDFVRGIPGRVLSAIGNLGSLLFNAGANLIRGLIDGISSMVSSLTSRLSFITDLIPDWKGPEDKDRRLLVPSGRAIMEGLQTGIRSEEDDLRSQLAGITASISAPGVTPSTTSETSGGVRVWPAQRQGANFGLTIDSGGSRMENLLVEVISHAVRTRGGDVQKVLGGRVRAGVT